MKRFSVLNRKLSELGTQKDLFSECQNCSCILNATWSLNIYCSLIGMISPYVPNERLMRNIFSEFLKVFFSHYYYYGNDLYGKGHPRLQLVQKNIRA